MLPVGALRQCSDAHGRTRFTEAEQRTMMTLWCMMRSPLMIGGELTKNDAFTLSLLTNAAVLDIEKKSTCAHPLRTIENESLWLARRIDGDGCYIAFFNLSDKPRTMSVPLEVLEGDFTHTYELWTKKTEELSNVLSAEVSSHDVKVFWAK